MGCASWQINWSERSINRLLAYIEDALDAAGSHLGRAVEKPWLCGLAQGGIAAFEFAEHTPEKFRGLIGISTTAEYPGRIGNLGKMPVHLIHGMDDDHISVEDVGATLAAIQKKGGSANLTLLKDAAHWLILSHHAKFKKFFSQCLKA